MWVKPKAAWRGAKPYWHWAHREDPTLYCGLPRPTSVLDMESAYEPLSKCCKKCLARIGREGY